jgi:hypothetical protein
MFAIYGVANMLGSVATYLPIPAEGMAFGCEGGCHYDLGISGHLKAKITISKGRAQPAELLPESSPGIYMLGT